MMLTFKRAWKSKGNSGNSQGNPTLPKSVRPLFNVSSITLSSIDTEKYYTVIVRINWQYLLKPGLMSYKVNCDCESIC